MLDLLTDAFLGVEWWGGGSGTGGREDTKGMVYDRLGMQFTLIHGSYSYSCNCSIMA